MYILCDKFQNQFIVNVLTTIMGHSFVSQNSFALEKYLLSTFLIQRINQNSNYTMHLTGAPNA